MRNINMTIDTGMESISAAFVAAFGQDISGYFGSDFTSLTVCGDVAICGCKTESGYAAVAVFGGRKVEFDLTDIGMLPYLANEIEDISNY